MRKKKIIIIGAGNAGLSAYKVLAKESDLCHVTIVSEESYLRYSPNSEPYLFSNSVGLYPPYGTPLSPFLIAGQVVTDTVTAIEDINSLASDCNNLILKKAIKVFPKDKKVLLEDGSFLSYDALIICTGAKPLIPQIKGKDARKVFMLRKKSDIENILATAKESKQVVIIGAGAAGIEAALMLNKQGLNVYIIEKNAQILSNDFDEEASGIIKSLLEQNGIKFYLKNTVSSINHDERGNVYSVSLANNEEINCDLVAIATGMEPNTEVVKESDIEVNRGILVNEYMETNYKDIFAAGDVAEAKGLFAGQKILFPAFMDTVEQGRVAAMNALELTPAARYESGLHVNVIAFNGSMLFSIGEVTKNNNDGINTNVSKGKHQYLQLIFDNDQLVAAEGVNLCLPVGIIRSLILKRTHLAEYKNFLLQKPCVPDTWISVALAKLRQ